MPLSQRTWPICLALEYGDQEHLLESLVISFKLLKEGKPLFQYWLTVRSVRPGSRRSSGRYSLANHAPAPAVFLHFPLEEKGALLSAPAGATKRETPTSNLTESTGLRLHLHYHICTSQSLPFLVSSELTIMLVNRIWQNQFHINSMH